MSDPKDEAARLKAEIGLRDRHIGDLALRDALNEVKVAPHFMNGAIALLRDKVTVATDGEVVGAVAQTVFGPTAISTFVEAWAASEAGRPYIAAPAARDDRTITREQFDRLPPAERAKAARAMKIIANG